MAVGGWQRPDGSTHRHVEIHWGERPVGTGLSPYEARLLGRELIFAAARVEELDALADEEP